jgi:hypothetical protein
VPEFVTRNWWERYLHNQTAHSLTSKLREIANLAVVSIRYHLPK